MAIMSSSRSSAACNFQRPRPHKNPGQRPKLPPFFSIAANGKQLKLHVNRTTILY